MTVDVILERLTENNPNISEDILLCWANMAKNSMQMVHGFSSNQHVYGTNPNLPNIMTDGLPAIEGKTSSKIFAKYLNAFHATRRAFIKSESSKRIRKSMKKKVRTNNRQFRNGEQVFFKRSMEANGEAQLM